MDRSLTETAYEALYEQISTGKIMPGHPVNEVALARSLGMSRTPVRDAITKLEKGGLLERKNGRTFAVEITYSRAADLCVLRAAIEGTAARLAATAATSDDLERLRQNMVKVGQAVVDGDASTAVPLHLDYHAQIVMMSRNNDLIAASSQADALIRRFRRISAENFGRLNQAIASHKAIFDAMQRGDADRCEWLMREDVLGGGAALLQVLQVFFGVDRITPSVSLVLEHAGTYRQAQYT